MEDVMIAINPAESSPKAKVEKVTDIVCVSRDTDTIKYILLEILAILESGSYRFAYILFLIFYLIIQK